MVFYVDFENVHLSGLNEVENLSSKDKVLIFCRNEDVARIKEHLNGKRIKALIECRIVSGKTKNALDFELISDLFSERKAQMNIIVSKDKGYDAAIDRGLRKGMLIFRKKALNQKGFETSLKCLNDGCCNISI